MKVILNKTLLDQCEPAIEDAVTRHDDPSDAVYIKMHLAKPRKNGSIVIDVNSSELAELIDRFEYEIETCAENISDIHYDPYELAYWRSRATSARAFIRKYK